MELENKWIIRNHGRKHSSFDDECEQQWKGPFFFIQAADCQLGLIERYIEKKPEPKWTQELELTKLAVAKINSLTQKPRFFVICGDLCDAFPTQQPELRAQQEKDLKKVLSELDSSIPLVCVCGNHDVEDKPTEDSIAIYKSSFGDDYFSFWCGGVLCIVVNSQLWMDGSLVSPQVDAQNAWLEGKLHESKNAVLTLIFQHIPWFLNDPNETEDSYYSLGQEIRRVWLPKFQVAGVKAIFAGHLHRNAGGYFEDVECVTTSAIGGQLGSDMSGMRVVKIYQDNIEHGYYSFDDFPSAVQM